MGMSVGKKAATAPIQRLRLTFAVSGVARYISHLDQIRAWVRAMRRLALPLAYSQGFNPQPRISAAAPLPVGFAAECELLDIYLDAPVDPGQLAAGLRRQLTAGLTLRAAAEVPLAEPPLPSQVVAADYVVRFLDPPPPDLAQRLARLLSSSSLPFTRVRQGKRIEFDLRPRLLAARIEECAGRPALILRLSHTPGGAARPEDVVQALDLPPASVRATRTRLVLSTRS